MNGSIIKTGIIGASLNNHWASQTHIPALQMSNKHRITAVATSKMESALESAAALGGVQAFTNLNELCESPEVDLVVVSIKVPFHYEAVKAAIGAGKHIYCEWPLTVTAAQAEELAVLADQAGIHHAVGLQARQSAVIQDIKHRIESGELGRVLSCNMRLSTTRGSVTSRDSAYLLKEENGATLLAINGGHSLDVLCLLLGDFKELSATMLCNYNEAEVLETGEKVAKDAADQIMVEGMLSSGASASVHVQGGTYPGFQLDIYGEKGMLQLKQQHSVGHVQFGNLQVYQTLYASGIPAAHDDRYFTALPAEEESMKVLVSKAHERFAADILGGTFRLPSFHDAARLHRLLETIKLAAATGIRQKL
ncbi:oxidoreductase [Paenibacillus glycanilyticus]|uniref:Oxidoreductase n=1 Tax=Paenibacillus glycanilyticus TaxID=126569 RepID=A0ABQ6NPM0_9BACL|nr:Gfo/Idh/MocA family oxidoreductase [Paenibacillus glycanilyticus]GMK47031.1 oxidoreductase [Paenibacillus glycanilyticus]